MTTVATEDQEQPDPSYEREARILDVTPGCRTSSGPAEICSAPKDPMGGYRVNRDLIRILFLSRLITMRRSFSRLSSATRNGYWPLKCLASQTSRINGPLSRRSKH